MRNFENRVKTLETEHAGALRARSEHTVLIDNILGPAHPVTTYLVVGACVPRMTKIQYDDWLNGGTPKTDWRGIPWTIDYYYGRTFHKATEQHSHTTRRE